ncbi:MAG: helix-turn-helix domain-containing protein [Streptosporangiaceae bacterium]|nr:helix-turn-helix domain-containing protein [Streptosporangiaceae bacterium]MBV9854501.1 helix-turn-helix domain-containing protein [Streptosporangiaceae bacterium]
MRTRAGAYRERNTTSSYPGPTVPRMVLGARLRRLREAAGVSREDAGRAIRASESKLSRLELGRTGFKYRDVADLLTLYSVGEEGERATLLELARHANASGWWSEYREVVPSWLEPFLGMEQAATLVRAYEPQFVPGLLQTEDYARAVTRICYPAAPDGEIERRVALRMCRQLALRRDDPLRLWAVLDEAVLRRPAGGSATMNAQIRHLAEAARLPNVKLQVLPLSVGGHAAAGGSISTLRFREAELPDVVYLEQLASAVYLTKPADTAFYADVLNRLAAEAEQPAETAARLHGMLSGPLP